MVVVEQIGLVAIGAGLAVGIAAAGSGLGQGQAVAAAIGATAENEKLFGKTLAMAAITETQALYGFATAIILIALGFGLITV